MRVTRAQVEHRYNQFKKNMIELIAEKDATISSLRTQNEESNFQMLQMQDGGVRIPNMAKSGQGRSALGGKDLFGDDLFRGAG